MLDIILERKFGLEADSSSWLAVYLPGKKVVSNDSVS